MTGSTCYYDPDEDFRRKGALRKQIAEQENDLRVYETIMESIRNGSEDDAEAILQFLRDKKEQQENSEVLDQIVQMLNAEGPALSSTLPPRCEADMSDFKPSQVKSSQSRHYGLTSNFILQESEGDLPSSVSAGLAHEWTTVTSDGELIEHLLALYFAWSHPFYLLFSQELFYHRMHFNRDRYCTTLLMNAILAVGCCYSDRPEARKDPNDLDTVGDHFFAEAQQLLDETQNQPSLTVVQALGLMSLREAMRNHNTRAQSYISQMMNMAVGLGMHTSQSAESSSTLTESEIEARRITFWGCFVLETTSAIYIGRISSLPRAAIGVEKPKVSPQLEDAPWRPFGTRHYDGGSSELVQPSRNYSILVQSSLLSEIVDDIIHMLHRANIRIKRQEVLSHHEKLQGWFRDLPVELRIRNEGLTLPHVIALQ
jgi:hypothetical protein